MKKRIFVGIKVSEKLQKEIARWRKLFESRLPVRWLLSKNLHLTLIPPWYEENLDSIKKALMATDFKVQPFEIAFHQVTFGPQAKNPRLIWAQGQTYPPLVILRDQLSKVLPRPVEKQPLLPHLTLARFRPHDFVNFPIKKLDEPVRWNQKVRSIALFEVHLLPSGADYQSLAEIRLT